jgi:phenylpropionate dioxygenase-like ring-hydroxylating dioxygenase large terminal subunit
VPYHHWSYNLDGRLVAAPAMSKTCNFDKAQYSLPTFKVELWNGFIFINFDADAAPLAPRLTAVAEAIAGYDLAHAEGPRPDPAPTLPWNWKVMFENNNDGYHASRLHHGPLHDFVPSGLAVFPTATRPMAVSCASTARCTPMPASTPRKRPCCRCSPACRTKRACA